MNRLINFRIDITKESLFWSMLEGIRLGRVQITNNKGTT